MKNQVDQEHKDLISLSWNALEDEFNNMRVHFTDVNDNIQLVTKKGDVKLNVGG